jgi:hypothetical protein
MTPTPLTVSLLRVGLPAPSLWPDLAHLPALLCVLVVAALAIGLGVLTGARRAETALIAGWGVAGLATVMVGTLSAARLEPVMLALGVAGLGGLVGTGIAAARGTPVLRCDLFGRVLVLALPLLAGIESMSTSGWDDFSHWLPNLAYLSLHGHFPNLAAPSPSDHAAYPYGLALPGFAVFLMRGGVAEDAALVWNVLSMLAGGACMAAVLDLRLPRSRATAWAVAAVGLLLGGLACPSFVAKIALSNMADSPSGSVLVVMVALVLDWWREPDRRGRDRIAITLGACGVALINLRQSNFALFLLGLIGLALAAAVARGQPGGGWRALALGAPPPLLAWALWNRYAGVEIPGGAFVILPVVAWHWAEFGRTVLSMLRIMLEKIGLFALILAVAVRTALALRRRDSLTPAQRALLLVATTLCIGNIGFLAFTYLAADFGADEASGAASFWRYAGQTGPLAVLALLAVIPIDWAWRLFRPPGAWAVVGLAVLLPIATARLYRYDLVAPVAALRRIALDIDSMVPRDAPVRLVDLTGNGFAPVVVAYQLWLANPGRPASAGSIVSNAHGFSVAAASGRSFAGTQYLWLAEGAPEMQTIFGIALHAGCGYLLQAKGAGFAILAAWQLPMSMRPVNAGGWSLRRGAACQ